MPSYRIHWDIDVEAATPKEAAQQALAIQRDPNSTATVFEVIPQVNGLLFTKDKWKTIDLSKENLP